jgi:hypothetical protein
MTTLKVTYAVPVPTVRQAPVKGVLVSLAVKPADPAVLPVFNPIAEVDLPAVEFDQASIDPGDYIVRLVVKDILAQVGGPVDTAVHVPFDVPGVVSNVVVTLA